ncbi:MAG: ribosome-associated translation inhibitor RaiA, partial [Candidatus Nealsonbacteria bacterium]
IKATNIKLNQSLRNFIQRKISKLENFFQTKPAKSFVEIGKTTHHHKKGPFFRAECQITVPGKKTIRAEVERKDLRLAIVEVKDELQLQLKQYKNKFIAKTKRRQRQLKKELHLSPGAKFYHKERIKEEGI